MLGSLRSHTTRSQGRPFSVRSGAFAFSIQVRALSASPKVSTEYCWETKKVFSAVCRSVSSSMIRIFLFIRASFGGYLSLPKFVNPPSKKEKEFSGRLEFFLGQYTST